MQIQSLSWKNLLEKSVATHSSIPAWRIPGTEKRGGLQPVGSQRGRHDWSNSAWTHINYWIQQQEIENLRSSVTPLENGCVKRYYSYVKVRVLGALMLVMPDSLQPMDCSLPDFFIYKILQARILEWVAIHFSRGSSQSRSQTWVSCIGGRFFTIWATREAHLKVTPCSNKICLV